MNQFTPPLRLQSLTQAENYNNMISEEDFAVASLAKLVGSELNVIDRDTVGGPKVPATRIHPRQFIGNNSQSSHPQKSSPHVVHHQGVAFHAGVDESYVQSLVPDPVPSVPYPDLVNVNPIVPQVAAKPTASKNVELPTAVQVQSNVNVEKTLKSIDKTLKSIDKTQKLLLEFLTEAKHNSKLTDLILCNTKTE